MINGEELFAALAHLPLCGKEIFGSCFVGDERVRSDVVEWVNRQRDCFGIAANQPATLTRVRHASLRDYLIKLLPNQLQHS